MFQMPNVWIAFALTLFAGLSTGIGSAIAFYAKRTNYRFLALSLAFSGGVMLYVSFVEIFPKAQEGLSEAYGARGGGSLAALAFFCGLGIIALIDRFVPRIENPHTIRTAHEMEVFEADLRRVEEENVPPDPEAAALAAARAEIATEVGLPATAPSLTATAPNATTNGGGGEADRSGVASAVAEIALAQQARLLRMGKFAAIAIAIHNFPEGLVSFFAALEDPRVGAAIAVAIALHNIPEGVSVSIPIFYATGSRRKAFLVSLLSGLAEPVGALLGFLLLAPFFGPLMSGLMFAFVAGIMVFISLDELLPAAREYGRGHETVYGIAAGMAVMAASLVLFAV